MMNRRDFLKYSFAAPALVGTGVQLLPFPVHASTGNWDRTLILLELKGGNDGLNTVVPFADKTYYDMRPTIAIPRDKVLKHSEKLGFHPAFSPLMPLWASGNSDAKSANKFPIKVTPVASKSATNAKLKSLPMIESKISLPMPG